MEKKFYNIKWDIEIRSHSSLVFNNILIIHGGFDKNNKVVKTLHLINIQSLLNNNPLMVSIDSGESIAQHKIVSTYGIDVNQRAYLTNNDGIITFGG